MASDEDNGGSLADYLDAALELVPTPDVIAKWREIQAQLSDLKKLETAYREIVLGRTFDTLNVGTNRRPLNDAEDLRVVVNQSIELMPATTLGKVMEAIRHRFGHDACDKFFYWETALNVDAYKAETNSELKKMVQQGIVTRTGKPQLSIVKAKAE